MRSCRYALLAAALSVVVAARAEGQTKVVPPVPAAALQKLLPAVEGWTSGVARADIVELSPEAKYSFASVTLTKNGHRVKIQIADTGFSADIQTALATMIVTLPEDYSGTVGSASIKRTPVGGSPAVESWDAEKSQGEIVVLVGGRFIVTVEAAKADGLPTLRALVEKVDLKALAALK